MLPAPHRMRRAQDFDAAVRTGRRAGRSTVVLHLAGQAGEPAASGLASRGALTSDADSGAVLVGFVVSKAVGSAVVRNRVKRRLRALVGQHVDRLDAGARLVVRANPAAADATFDALSKDVDSAMRKVTQGAGVGPRG